MVLLVTTLTPKRPADVAGASALPTDLLEVRLDALEGEIGEAIARADLPVVASCRRAQDGGLAALPEDERHARLLEALRSGAAFVDVEDDAPFRAELTREAALTGALVIVSYHDLEGTPAPKVLLDRLGGMRKGADVVKVATRAGDPTDVEHLFEAALEAPTLGTPFALMGVGDAAVRAAAGPLGMALVYTAPGRAEVPGQLPAHLQRALPRAPPPPVGFRDYVLLGHPVAHSLSPRMQNAAFSFLGEPARYRPIDVDAAAFPAAFDGLLAMDVAGGNATSPHKDALYERCDVATPAAEEARAVNTFAYDGTAVSGHNTDGLGVIAALGAGDETLDGRAVLVVGAGGTARSAAHALARAGARLHVTNRTTDRAEALARETGAELVSYERSALEGILDEGAVLFNATPADPPVGDRHLAGVTVFDATYGVDQARLARRARLAGARVLDGLDLLVHQGELGLRFWLDLVADARSLGVMSTAARTGALEARFQRSAP